ncbi:MAG: diacylglycerol kinase family protein [bacterium]
MKRRLRSFGFAFRGLVLLFSGQPNAWIHLFAAVGVIAAGIALDITATEWLLVVFAIGFVFTAELFNSAIEELVNIVSPDRNSAAGKIKDLAAGGVLLAAITAAVIGSIIFIPKILSLF